MEFEIGINDYDVEQFNVNVRGRESRGSIGFSMHKTYLKSEYELEQVIIQAIKDLKLEIGKMK